MKSPGARFEDLLEYLRRTRCFDFTGYKRPSLMRRMSHRMAAVGIKDYTDYTDYLEVHPEELGHLFNHILINVTAFFRDPACWDHLAREIVPKIVAGTGKDETIRVWSAGCASGEEAYSLAMVFAESMEPEEFKKRVKIYASDVDEEALAQARLARFRPRDLQNVPAPMKRRYFHESGGFHVFDPDLRRSVIFGRHDLVHDAPISRTDLLVCRNTLMYLNAEMQGRILARMHFALKDEGYLFIGRAEMLLSHTALFQSVSGLKYRIFSKVPQIDLRDRLLIMAQAGGPEAGTLLARQVRLREAACDRSPVAQVVADTDGRVVFANQRARELFKLGSRDLGRPLHDFEMFSRPVELRSLIDQAYAGRKPVEIKNVPRRVTGDVIEYFDVQVTPLQEEGSYLGVSITFADVTLYHNLGEELQQSHQELEHSYEEIQSSNEEQETTNEELQTTNEELQSTNEELETMNEELQSTNEELCRRTDEIDRSNSFLKSILASLRAAVVVLDPGLEILIWNARAEDLWGLRAEEAAGKAFLSLDIGLPVKRLAKAIRASLAGESDHHATEVEAVNRRGKPLRCRVSLAPLFDGKKERRGVVLVMEEISA